MFQRIAFPWMPSAAAALILCIASTASAGGLFMPEVGTRTMQRGASGLAVVNDPSALWYNPAGLVSGSGTELLLDVSIVDTIITYERTRSDGTTPFCARSDAAGSQICKVRNDGFPFIIPILAAATDFGLKNWRFGAGVTGPMGYDYAFPARGPQRYVVIDSQILQIKYMLGAAWRPVRWLDVGVTALLNQFDINQRMIIPNSADLENPENPAADAFVEIATRGFTPSANLGITGDLPVFDENSPWFLRVAAGMTTRVPVRTKGKLGLKAPDTPELSLVGDEINLSTELPWMFRGGVAFGRDEVFDLALDFVYETWSLHKEILIEPQNVDVKLGDSIIIDNLKPIPVARGFTDVWSLRFGGQYTLPFKWMGVRAGVYYEKGAIPDEFYTVGNIDRDKIGLAGGVTFSVSAFDIDLGFVRTLIGDVTVKNGKYPALNVLQPNVTNYVNDGRYTGLGANVIMAGLRTHFDRFGSKEDDGAREGAAPAGGN
ncbi:MAG: hypothetical protein GMKNLPBB_00414 [Myxococcota bacterium]|nr:hypothetical protein [Myxococcota bacterium]